MNQIKPSVQLYSRWAVPKMMATAPLLPQYLANPTRPIGTEKARHSWEIYPCELHIWSW